MSRPRGFAWLLIGPAVLALVLLLRAGGQLAPLENAAADARARVLQHEVSSDIIIVGIDARSLADLQQWPWPRRYHARLLEKLADAQPRRVFMDIDFSARSTAEDDALLEAALARFDQPPVILPAFFQRATGADGGMTVTQPHERFARRATLAGINLEPGRDSLVRNVRSTWSLADTTMPSAVAVVAEANLPAAAELPIDYSISPASFEFISYVDLMAGRVAPSDLRGKTILIGATAVELGDMLPVPVYQSQPGIVVQALAIESLRNGVPPVVPAWLNITALTLVAFASALFFCSNGWRWNLAVLGCVLMLATVGYVYAFAVHRISFEVVPVPLATLAILAVVTLRSLDEQTLRALAYALGIRRRDALLRSIVESSTDCIVCVDRRGSIRTANAAGARLFACGIDALLAAPLSRFIPALTSPGAGIDPFAALTGRVCEQDGVRSDGSRFSVEISISRVSIADEPLYTVIIRDVSERKVQQRTLQYQATHDPLTALPNRVALASYLESALARSTGGRSVALLMLDLCRFKEVNDTLGHHVGDQVLCEVARRFESVSSSGFIARIGGDEFTMVFDGVDTPDTVAQVSQTLNECLRTPIEAAGVAIDVGVSIGIALYPQDATEAASLLKKADVAMYAAKRLGSAYEFYEASYDQHSVRRLTMVSELRKAIDAGQLSLHYQPQVDLRIGQARSVEALLRWRHPQFGAVNPAEFITVAEATDLIHPLTEWTLEEALAQAARWREADFRPRIAVNLSARLLQDSAFPARLNDLLRRHRADPQALELEITESAMMLDTSRALRVIRELHQLGVMMSVDDFGTGFSSLGYLRDLPVHALKLDKSFVLQMQERADDRIIVDSTVQMAHALRLQVVAEGVETQWHARYLAAAGYDYAQGYHYSAALAAEPCLAWMRNFNSQSQSATIHPAGEHRPRRAG